MAVARCCASKTPMNHRVQIERPGGTAQAGGHVDLTDDSNWQHVDGRWAAFTTRGGKEGRVFDQVQAEVTHIIALRHDALTRQIDPTWRIRMGDRKFNIRAAYDVDEAGETVRIEATEVK